MKREIKFRAWDKFNDQMWHQKDSIGLFFTNMEELIEGENGIEIMQFTGLKDNSGKEIYEGDIISYFDLNTKRVGVVRWGMPSECGFIIDDDYNNSDSQDWWDILSMKEIEIIGNIFTTPELIKS